jgi:hypothetical protein
VGHNLAMFFIAQGAISVAADADIIFIFKE